MGVNICICEKQPENVIKGSSIDCYKNSYPSNFPYVITANKINLKTNTLNENYQSNKKYKNKFFNENQQTLNSYKVKLKLSSTYSNTGNISNKTQEDDKYIQNITKIQYFFREYLKTKNQKIEKIINERIQTEKDTLSLKLNREKTDSIHFSDSLNNSSISQEKTIIKNNETKNQEKVNRIIPFNLKKKLKTKYKYSGFMKKIKKNKNDIVSLKNGTNDSNLSDKKEVDKNNEKYEYSKEGFGKYIFNDGTEFCGIFHNNILQNYGKYSNINHKNKNQQEKNDKEIIITDNLNYEEFIGEYKNYSSDGFGIYKNFITNLKITGIFKKNGISGIAIEDSVEGGYIYTGDFNNNKKEGYGTIIWRDGNKYQGEFKDNQLNGYGIIEFTGDKFYQGEVKNGRMDGFGEFFWKDEKRYIGNYKNDKRNGFGIFIFQANSFNIDDIQNNDDNNSNGFSAYIGFWKNGNMDGLGMKVNKIEIKYGLWENGTKRKILESNFLKTYIKWIDKKYYKLFLGNRLDILKYIEKCVNIDDEINPNNQKNS